MYKTDDILINKIIPNRGSFRFFVVFTTILLGGIITASSFLVPAKWHLSTTFLDTNEGAYISWGLIAISAIYAAFNVFLDPAYISYLVSMGLIGVSFFINKQKINNWIVHGFISLYMIDNFQFLINAKVGGLWKVLHYFFYALQLALTMFGLIKLDKFNLFSIE